jgi:Tol biopolymer transport system component
MGEVYRARDTKLNRDVAIKVLPDLLAADLDRLARFEREARAVAALSHPNILAIYDFGTDGKRPYAVMELLDGTTLRGRMDSAPLTPRRAVEYAIQIARGLSAAHDKGIVHRDLKPENLFITSDGHLKILDFGLARLLPASMTMATAEATVTRVETSDGVVLGTVGYMSPEQVRGSVADHRSDIFSFGAVLYEMLSGRRAFGGDSAVETMSAILKEEPADFTFADASLGPALARVVHHCLEKEPSERFQSARDLAFALEALRGGSGHGVAVPVPGRRLGRVSTGIAAALVCVGVAAGWFGHRVLNPRPALVSAGGAVFTRLTYDKGTIRNGRFAPDGKTIVYAAAWDGKPIRTFLTRTERVGATPLNLPDASILSISSTGELAVSLGHTYEGWMGEGTLARVPMFGGAPRAILEHVREADWTPDGSDLAIVRRMNGRERLEFPIGTTLYETGGYISHIRFSPDGERIAFADHQVYADDNGDIALVDRAGRKRTLATGMTGVRGIAWSPDGREVWFTANNIPYAGDLLRAVALDGRTRPLLSIPTDGKLLDVARDGRVLLETEAVARHIEAWFGTETQPHDLTLFDQSIGSVVSPDGRSVLITDQGSFTGTSYATYLRRLDQPEAVKLGDGQAQDFSPDGRWALSLINGPPSRILLLPLGAGQMREVPNRDGLTIQILRWLPDGKHIVSVAARGNEPQRGYIHDIETGTAKPFTAPGVNFVRFWLIPMSPDGSQVVLTGPDGRMSIYPTRGGEPVPLTALGPAEYPIDWTADGHAMFVSTGPGLPHRIVRLDLATGRREPWKELMPSQVAGTRLTQVQPTRDGRAFVHTYSQLLSNLYVAEGLPR